MKREYRGKLLLIVYAALLLLTVALVLRFGAPRQEERKKVGFITAGDITSGNSRTNHTGIRTACEDLGVDLLTRDQVPEAAGVCPQAVRELVEEGVEMIIFTSPMYSLEMKPYFDDYSQIAFYGPFASLDVPNLTGYSTRMYQARYLSGIVAGMQTESGKIGFVATAGNNEVNRNINAFTLGARRVNPDAEVVVLFAGNESIPEEDAQAARTLIREEGVDVITHHAGQSAVITTAEEEGVASIGCYEPMEGLSDKYLTCAAGDWEILYKELIQEYLKGQRGKMLNDWLGLSSGVIRLTGYSPMVSQETINEVELARREILSGLDVFTNEIYDNEGTLRCGAGEAMSDESLMQRMDWLVEGVRVYE